MARLSVALAKQIHIKGRFLNRDLVAGHTELRLWFKLASSLIVSSSSFFFCRIFSASGKCFGKPSIGSAGKRRMTAPTR